MCPWTLVFVVLNSIHFVQFEPFCRWRSFQCRDGNVSMQIYSICLHEMTSTFRCFFLHELSWQQFLFDCLFWHCCHGNGRLVCSWQKTRRNHTKTVPIRKLERKCHFNRFQKTFVVFFRFTSVAFCECCMGLTVAINNVDKISTISSSIQIYFFRHLNWIANSWQVLNPFLLQSKRNKALQHRIECIVV